MSSAVYIADYSCQLPPEQFNAFIGLLPPRIAEKARSYRRWQDAYGCVFGKLLLQVALQKMARPADLRALQYSRANKPFLPDGPCFNISHSGNRVVCVINRTRRVGVDIERRADDIPIDEYRSQFTLAEWTSISNAPSPNERFFDLWTAKESLIKADGRGLELSLKKIDVAAGGIVVVDGLPWMLTRLALGEGYHGHVAVGVSDEEFCSGEVPQEITDLEVCEVSTVGMYEEFCVAGIFRSVAELFQPGRHQAS
jgi:4'-phosphopantetheinyl transferase